MEFKNLRVAMHNLGCKVNSYEAEAMVQELRTAGAAIVPWEDFADIYIINTCSVTNIADRKSRQMLHKAKLKNPEGIVIGAGCYVRRNFRRTAPWTSWWATTGRAASWR